MTGLMDALTNFRCFNCDAKLAFWPVRGMLYRMRFRLPAHSSWFTERDPLYDPAERDDIRCDDCRMDLTIPRARKILVEAVFWALFILSYGAILYLVLRSSMIDDPMPMNDKLKFLSEGRRPPSGNRVEGLLLTTFLALPVSYILARIVSYRCVRLERHVNSAAHHPAIPNPSPRR